MNDVIIVIMVSLYMFGCEKMIIVVMLMLIIIVMVLSLGVWFIYLFGW